jgi:hypothetical protein
MSSSSKEGVGEALYIHYMGSSLGTWSAWLTARQQSGPGAENRYWKLIRSANPLEFIIANGLSVSASL